MKGGNQEYKEKYAFSLYFEQRNSVGNCGHWIISSAYTNAGYLRKGETILDKEKYQSLGHVYVLCDSSPCFISILYTSLKYSVVLTNTDKSISIHKFIRNQLGYIEN